MKKCKRGGFESLVNERFRFTIRFINKKCDKIEKK